MDVEKAEKIKRLEEKIRNQSERLRILEGATNHAGGLAKHNDVGSAPTDATMWQCLSDPGYPKSELEHFAARKIEMLARRNLSLSVVAAQVDSLFHNLTSDDISRMPPGARIVIHALKEDMEYLNKDMQEE